MSKYNIDDILSELSDSGKPQRKGGKHRIDQSEAAFSPLPSMPAHQGDVGRQASLDDPAVKQRPRTAPDARVGKAISDVFSPEGGTSGDEYDTSELAQELVSAGAVSAEDMAQAQAIVKQTPGRRLVEVLLERGADEESVQRVVAQNAGLTFERIDLHAGLEGGFDGQMLQRLGGDYCRGHLVMPLRMEGQRAVMGVVRPDDVFLFDELRERLGVVGVKVVVVTGFDIRGALEVAGLGEQQAEPQDVDLNEILDQVDEQDVQVEKSESQEVDLEQKAGESPVIRYVNYIIQQAIKEGASDIHIEPADKKLKVRFRIDGVLFEAMNPPAAMSAAITSRLKIMANLDISERRIPQDGRIRCVVAGRKLDLRMSTLPNTYGEKTVMRILDTKSINVQLEDLGFAEDTLQVWRSLVTAPHGITLVTGPTGSGKTTTLYASLRTLDKNKMNISTVEDPVEYHLEGITQTQTHEKIGMTFAKALKALLRQDPDVIMLGEIRDMETALTAVQAALTGHLVLSTLHTNDAPSSITRLVNIGLEPFLVGAAVNGVLAQRLLRRLCKHCKTEETPSEEMAEFLEMQGLGSRKVWTAKGCEKCRGTGYSGRVGIYELLAVDDRLRDVIAGNPNVSEFRRMCMERGMITLRMDGMNKVKQGLSTVQEVLRVTDGNH
ncbi:MAG: Flp pilus assembly complex ATPase component TadA [Phycisphaeraceae bacterium]|nr:Flp pilus assembly complex ATPase component TadA [Phycisphaeraceae bacterium]